MRHHLVHLVVFVSLAWAGCSGAYEQEARRDISSFQKQYSAPAGHAPDAPPGDLERGLPGYVAYAMAKSPELRAGFERWQASVYEISRARRLPEPTLSFAYFVQSVETRVGPQIARVSLQQTFPWPTKLTAGADAASARARALQRQFDARALALTQRIADVYWRIWLVRQARSIHREHLEVLRSLSESVLARVATGAATLADQQQVDLAAARLEDLLAGLDEAERAAEARLRAAIGARGSIAVPTPGAPPDAELPSESESDLEGSARSHPTVAAFELLAESEDWVARREEADRFPGLTIGADWIITGESGMPDVPDSGKDAVVVGAGIRVPLWQASYSDSVAAARSMADAQRAEARAAADQAVAQLASDLSSVRDAVRRVRLFRETLVPQAEAAYASVLGAYVSGRGTVAQTLLAQRDLLELRVEFDQSRADYAQGWARLEQVVGREIARSRPMDRDDAREGAAP
ncbi:MAG TPA: TolC family protein [Polyangia bacterium]|nr:TolC family protein [Polyangia bacterium]